MTTFPKITPELYDELNANLDTTWPEDPADGRNAKKPDEGVPNGECRIQH